MISGTVVSGKTVGDLDANTNAAVGELLQTLRRTAGSGANNSNFLCASGVCETSAYRIAGSYGFCH